MSIALDVLTDYIGRIIAQERKPIVKAFCVGIIQKLLELGNSILLDEDKHFTDICVSFRRARPKELGKVNRVDLDDEKELPYELIVVQPFSPSLDPTLIGLKRIDNLEEVKARLRKQLAADNPDIEDIDYELADLEEESLFPDTEDETSISE